MPLRFSFASEEPWHTKKVHKMGVNNFIVYYIVDEQKKSSENYFSYIWS